MPYTGTMGGGPSPTPCGAGAVSLVCDQMANGLQIIHDNMAEALPGALGSNEVNGPANFNNYGGTALKRSFLMKKFRFSAYWKPADIGNVCMLVLGRGDMSAPEVKEALQSHLQPDDEDYDIQQIKNRRIFDYWEFSGVVSSAEVATMNVVSDRFGGGKGIPFEENVGWQWYLYNPSGSAWIGSPKIAIFATHWGVWLD